MVMSDIIGILKLQPIEDESDFSKRVPQTEEDEMSVEIQSRLLRPEHSPAFPTHSQQDSMSFVN